MDGIDRERDYWGPERASYEDELDAWRARTAAPIVALVAPLGLADPGHPFIGGLFGQSWRRPRRTEARSHAHATVEAPLGQPQAA